MKNIYKKLIYFILPLFLFGCVFSENERVPQGDFDVVFETEINGNETIGFYSEQSRMIQNLINTPSYSNPRISFPMVFLISSKKKTSYEIPGSFVGYIDVLRKSSSGLLCKTDDFFTNKFRPYGEYYAIYRSGYFNLVKPDKCRIVDTLLDLQATNLKRYIEDVNSFSIQPQSNFLILSLRSKDINNPQSFNLVRIDLTSNEILSYNKFGINPSLSPDGNMVAYLSEDGIRIMDIDGNDIIKVTKDPLWKEGEEGYLDSVPSKPEWFPDGTKLISHKCSTL